mgnify:CR=1 FL=1
MLIRDNWFVGVTGNIGYKDSKVNNGLQEKSENFITYTGAIKGGYDIELRDRRFVIQPNTMLMYAGINALGYEEEVETKGLNNLIAEPGLKMMLDLGRGWKPYIMGGYAFNMGKVVVEEKDLNVREDKGIDNYVEYGAGIEKQFENIPLSAYLTAKGRNGGRNGYSGYVGIKWGFGDNKEEKDNKRMEEKEILRETQETGLIEEEEAEVEEEYLQ